MKETITFKIGNGKRDCTCSYGNGTLVKRDNNCPAHAKKIVVEQTLTKCRFCGESFQGSYHLCKGKREHLAERDRIEGIRVLRERKTKTKQFEYYLQPDFCTCKLDERGLVIHLSFDCPHHAPHRERW